MCQRIDGNYHMIVNCKGLLTKGSRCLRQQHSRYGQGVFAMITVARAVQEEVFTVFNHSLTKAHGTKALKGPVKLIQRVKIAHSFLQSVSNQFHVIILRLPM